MISATTTLKYLFNTWLFFELAACAQHQQAATIPDAQKKPVNDSNIVSRSPDKFRNIQEVVSTEKYSLWQHGKQDASARFHFGNATDPLQIEYYPECWGSYSLKIKNDTILAFWNADLDTKYNFEVAKVIKQQKVKHGTPFLAFTLLNDTTLNVVYLNEELAKKINAADTTVTFLPKQLTAEPIPE